MKVMPEQEDAADPVETEEQAKGEELAETTTPQAPEQTQQTQPTEEKQAPAEVQDAQPDQDQTADELLAPYMQLLEDSNRKAAPKIRDVATRLHEQGVTLLNNDLYYKIRKKVCQKLGVTTALMDKEVKKVLEVADKDNSDEPRIPPPAAGAAKTGAGTSPPPTQDPGASSGGAPFAPATIGGEATTPDTATTAEEADEPMVWDKKKVGTVMTMFLNMPSWGLEEYPRITKEERDELGTSFLQIFQEYLPTSKKTGNLLYIGATLEAIMKPRIMAVMQYRLMHKELETVKANAQKEIAELNGIGGDKKTNA